VRTLLVALVLLAACGPRVVYRTRVEYLPAPPCRSSDYPRPGEGVLPPSDAWHDWFALEVAPWMRKVEAECPRAKPATGKASP
jgi:hypothetical protein